MIRGLLLSVGLAGILTIAPTLLDATSPGHTPLDSKTAIAVAVFLGVVIALARRTTRR